MDVVKLIFAVMFLIPIGVLMWYLINKLINEAVASAKRASDRTEAARQADDKRDASYGRRSYSAGSDREKYPQTGAAPGSSGSQDGYGDYGRPGASGERIRYTSYPGSSALRERGARYGVGPDRAEPQHMAAEARQAQQTEPKKLSKRKRRKARKKQEER